MKFKAQNNHAHAIVLFEATSWKHFYYLFLSILLTKLKRYKSLTCHLPLEIQHPQKFRKHKNAIKFISFGEFLKRKIKIKLYWENAPLLEVKNWSLRFGQSSWKTIPENIDLCIDTGHLILGSKNKEEARKRIELIILKQFVGRVKHLHIHENDLISDHHWNPSKVRPKDRILTGSLIDKITKGKTYIYEKG